MDNSGPKILFLLIELFLAYVITHLAYRYSVIMSIRNIRKEVDSHKDINRENKHLRIKHNIIPGLINNTVISTYEVFMIATAIDTILTLFILFIYKSLDINMGSFVADTIIYPIVVMFVSVFISSRSHNITSGIFSDDDLSLVEEVDEEENSNTTNGKLEEDIRG